MTREPVVIPEKIYFKIGEVCELVDVQAQYEYWETEFSLELRRIVPQSSYSRRDVGYRSHKGVLYDELIPPPGARKRLQAARENGKSKR